MYRIIIILVVIYLFYRITKYFRHANTARMDNNQFKPTPVTGEDLVEDPVCHTYIPVSQAYKKEIAGKIYCFCSKECCDSYMLENTDNRQK